MVERLAGDQGARAVLQQVGDPGLGLAFQFGGGTAFAEQAQFAGAASVEALGGQRIAPRGALADGLDHERGDGRRDQADAYLGQAEGRVVAADGHIAATDQADPAAEHRALDHRQGRLGQVVEMGHEFGDALGVGQVALVVEVHRLLHPGQVGTAAEVPATAAQHQQADLRVAADAIDGLQQFADHDGIEGVVLFRPVQPQGGYAARVDLKLDGLEFAHAGLLVTCGTRRRRSARWGR